MTEMKGREDMHTEMVNDTTPVTREEVLKEFKELMHFKATIV